MTPPLSYRNVILSEAAYGGLPTIYYPCDEATGTTVADLMALARGTGYNSTISGTTSRDQRPGPISKDRVMGGTYFDGATVADTASSPTIGNNQNLTIECWVYATGGGFGSVSHVFNSRFGAGLGVYRIGGVGPDDYYVAAINADNEIACTSVQFSTSVWTHLAVVFNSSGSTGYVNGVSAGTTVLPTKSFTLGATRLGGRPAQAFGYYTGRLAHAALYQYGVAAERLRYHAMAGANGIFGQQKHRRAA